MKGFVEEKCKQENGYKGVTHLKKGGHHQESVPPVAT
jgi:hypothetical protein